VYHTKLAQLNKPIYCWKVDGEEADETEGLRKMNIKETKGECMLQEEASTSTPPEFLEPLKIKYMYGG
jgi:hypothetical protein